MADSIYFNASSDEKLAASTIKSRFKQFFDLLLQCAQSFPTSSALFEAQQVGNSVANNVFWTKVLGAEFSYSKATTNGESLFPILIIIDEARGLKGVDDTDANSIYMELRRALVESTGFLCIMIDTNAKISNFAPTVKEDPSARVCRGQKLFHPWTSIPTINLDLPLAPVVSNVQDIVKCDGLKSYRYNRFDILKYSRPMFICASLFDSNSAQNYVKSPAFLWSELMNLAHVKLFGTTEGLSDDIIRRMVVLAGRYCLVPVDIASQESLVANRMATLQACSVGRKRMVVDYAVEPVLGETFAHYMTEHFEAVMDSLCREMEMNKLSLAGNKGDFGELIAAIIMTRAYDLKHSLPARHFSQPVMVHDILSSFTSGGGSSSAGGSVVNKKVKRKSQRNAAGVERKGSSLILRSLVRYLQFSRLSKPPTPAALEAGFRRCAAFLTVSGTAACDLVIPILLGEERCESNSIIIHKHFERFIRYF